MTLILVAKIGLTTRNIHVEYELSFITYNSKVMANVKVFCRQTDKTKITFA